MTILKEYRIKRGLTQEELAQKLFLSRKAISKWETGRGFPDSTILPRLAEELGVRIDELFDGEKEEIENFYRDFHNKHTPSLYDKLLFRHNHLPLLSTYAARYHQGYKFYPSL